MRESLSTLERFGLICRWTLGPMITLGCPAWAFWTVPPLVRTHDWVGVFFQVGFCSFLVIFGVSVMFSKLGLFVPSLYIFTVLVLLRLTIELIDRFHRGPSRLHDSVIWDGLLLAFAGCSLYRHYHPAARKDKDDKDDDWERLSLLPKNRA